jgi:hypothetical protein
MDWRFHVGQDLKRDELALGCNIQGIDEGMKNEPTANREYCTLNS